jgi:hypothetical protein
MKDDASEMVDAKPLADVGFRRKRNTGNNLCQTFDDKTERLSGDSSDVKPAEKPVYQNCLKPLRNQPSHEEPHRVSPAGFFAKPVEIGLNIFEHGFYEFTLKSLFGAEIVISYLFNVRVSNELERVATNKNRPKRLFGGNSSISP